MSIFLLLSASALLSLPTPLQPLAAVAAVPALLVGYTSQDSAELEFELQAPEVLENQQRN